MSFHKKLLDAAYIKRNTPNLKDLKVTIKKNKKGTGLYATKTIKKGSVIAYYRITAYKDGKYKSPTKFMYTFKIYTKKENLSRSLIGDLSLESLPPPCRNIPYWAYFSNEPSPGEEPNSYIDINTEYNYRGRTSIKEGDTLIYKLRAAKTIQPGQEILWCYGDSYDRKYSTACD